MTLESGILDAGFGQKVAGYYGPDEMKVFTYGLPKEFNDRFDVQDVLKDNHMSPRQIVEDIL